MGKIDELIDIFKKMENVSIVGRNMDEEHGAETSRFGRLSEQQSLGLNEEQKEQAEALEDFTEQVFEKAESTEITPIEQTTDKKHVVLRPGMIYHKLPTNLKILCSISKSGILASEWFGTYELEGEGRFCAFVTKVPPEDAPNYRKQTHKNSLNDARNISLFLDEKNELVQKLLSIDMFEYQNDKKNKTPQELAKKYPDKIIEIYERLIVPLSRGGAGMRSSPMLPFMDWSAIPGGIPSQLVNGICIHSKACENTELVDQIVKLFPNATIFNEKMEIVRQPILTKNRSQSQL